ncbi:MAG TPA: hypothetical protein PK185_04670 [Cyclobacteriaceae bacterium]|nr:hypothetical protein [Cyclobacteriaceae bacterium]HRK53185.1 hypothetical protein [Cyclobacteriaceae bacterium]
MNWTITDGSGSYQFGSTSTSSIIFISWDDRKPNKVTLQAVIQYFDPNGSGSCASPETITRTFTHVLRSVFGETITAGTLPAVPYCNTSAVNVLVNHMYIQNTGGIAEPPLAEVNNYQWILPTGWKEVGGASGTVYTNANAIAIEPINPSGNCSAGGNILVRGIAGLTSCAGLLVSQSYQKTIPLNRTPSFTISASGGYTGQQQCGQTTPVTFSVPAQSCASSYTWNFPSGWSGSSTSNSIVLTPSGGANVAGSITVTTSVNNGLCTLASPQFTISYSNPTLSISSGSPVCTTGSTFTLNNVPPGSSVSWQASPSSLFSSSSGSGASAFLTALSSKSSGAGDITFYVSNPGCNLNAIVPGSLWVGKPSGVITNPTGVPAVEANLGSWVVFWAIIT